MKKEKNESTGTTAAAATAKAEEKVLVAQQESISENEVSSITLCNQPLNIYV